MDARVPLGKTTSVFSERTVQSLQNPVIIFMRVKPFGSMDFRRPARGLLSRLCMSLWLGAGVAFSYTKSEYGGITMVRLGLTHLQRR